VRFHLVLYPINHFIFSINVKIIFTNLLSIFENNLFRLSFIVRLRVRIGVEEKSEASSSVNY
jgi:hypothetical protein